MKLNSYIFAAMASFIFQNANAENNFETDVKADAKLEDTMLELDPETSDQFFRQKISDYVDKKIQGLRDFAIHQMTLMYGTKKLEGPKPHPIPMCRGILELYPTKEIYLSSFPSYESMCGANDGAGTCRDRRDWQINNGLVCY